MVKSLLVFRFLVLVLGHIEPNPHWWITDLNTYHPKRSQQHMHTLPHNPHWFPCRVACSPSRICVWPGLMLFIASTFLCGGIAEVNPPLPEKQNKTMESVRHSKANGFTAASSPPSLFMCKSIHRVLMAPVMHDTDSFKWPRKKWEPFTHLQSWQKTIQVGCIESAFLSQDGANVCLLF